MTFQEAQLQFTEIVALLRRYDSLPVSYHKVIDAMTVKLHTLASAERNLQEMDPTTFKPEVL